MRIAYCTNVRLPSERAHGHQVASVCSALAKLGHDVTIFAPYRRNPIKEDFWTYHHADKSVKLQTLGTFDPIDRWWLPGVLGLWVLNGLLRGNMEKELSADRFDVIYTRSPALLPMLQGSGIPIILELHRLPTRAKYDFVKRCNNCALVVCLTSVMRNELVKWGVKSDKVIVEGDAVDLSLFHRKEDRSAFDLPSDKPLIGYAGQLTSMGLSKGLDELLGAIRLLIERKTAFHALIAGGSESAVASLKQSLGPAALHVTFTGFIPHEKIPGLIQSCDVLVYPAPASNHPFYTRDTSPLKILEYMAAGVPIVSADLPPLHDLLSSENAVLVPAGDAGALADGIAQVLANPEEAKKRAHKAHEQVKKHTWEERMKRIFEKVRQ